MSTVRVFVCSAYRDMQAERQYLHEVIFPRVQASCQENGVTFEVVDPRHSAESEEQAEGIDSLDQALNDVDGCRPYFIGILGQHYSRIYIEIPHEVGLRHESVRHFFRCSRTHLEALYGVLKAPSAQAYFYARKPEYLDQVPAAERLTYDADTEIARHKLFMMKRAIGAADLPVREYDAQWDDMQKKLVGLEAFGEMVAADLLAMAGISEAPAAVPMVAETPMDTGEIIPMDTGEVMADAGEIAAMETVDAAPMAFEDAAPIEAVEEVPMDAVEEVPMEAVEEVPMEEVAAVEEMPMEEIVPMEEAAAPFEGTAEPFGETAGDAVQPFEEQPLAFEEAASEQPMEFADEQPFDLGGDDVQVMEEASEEVIINEGADVPDEDIDLASIFEDDQNK